ncbi:MAG: hypothetical protein M1819_005392 [Sarea resinae]|nr:MAG: hypothetical protein M1819_005392 [Sarea resinae]
MASQSSPRRAWATLLTRPSYLAGVIVLAYALKKQASQYPLIVLVTDSLPTTCLTALELEAPHTNLAIKHVDSLLPAGDVNLIAERFADTWTKLRVFELTSYKTLVFLDADIMVMRNMDDIFETGLPAQDWLAANHACVCNLDHDPWAPEDWTPENCPYTPLRHPDALSTPTPVTEQARPTYHLLNSGVFMFHPSEELWDRMHNFFNTTPSLKTYKFPDQDFLADFFKNRWMSMGWQYNAIKTMRNWHENIWRDDEVKALHYIVDKPWASRIGAGGKAGYRGLDGVTHTWWWKAYDEWEHERENNGESHILSVVRKYVAGKDDQENEELQAIGTHAQAFASNDLSHQAPQPSPGVTDKSETDGKGSEEDEAASPGGHVFRAKRRGERGHGPVVRLRHGDNNSSG